MSKKLCIKNEISLIEKIKLDYSCVMIAIQSARGNKVSSMHISVIIPVYKCCDSLHELSDRLIKTLSLITEDFEIIMVNDASPDQSWNVIKQLSSAESRIKGIKFSRNFGQHRAITAGLDHARGDWVVVMDCDLQDKPEEITKLYSKVKEGYDIVFGRRHSRNDSFFKKTGSKLFYKVFDYFTDSKIDNTVANFSIISSAVVKAMRTLREQNRSYPLFINWVGFARANVDVEHAKRVRGKSSYTFKKLLDLAIDSIVSQSNKPLRLSIKLGFLMSILSILYGVWLIIRYFMFSIEVEGWTSVMVSIYFIGGLMFANMGIVGLYIGKIFDETKGRPLYIIEETV